MYLVKDKESIKKLNDNSIIGNIELINSIIRFNGKNNILFCQNNVKLKDSIINFNGDNSIIFLSKSVFPYLIKVQIFNNSLIFFGKNNNINPFLRISVRESKNLVIGDDCIFGANNSIKISDGCLLYDLNSKKRLNSPDDVYIGNHIFFGDECHISMGCNISSGTFISDFSTLPNYSTTKPYCQYGGNPIKLIHENVYFKNIYTGYFNDDDFKKYEVFTDDLGDNNHYQDYDNNIFKAIKNFTSSDKLEFIQNVFIPLKQKNNSNISDIDFSKYKLTIKGLNDFYFLINDTNQELRQHFDKEYDNNFNKLQFNEDLDFKYNLFSKYGINYYYFVVPDKSVICKELLPFSHNFLKRNIDSINNFKDFSNVLKPEDYFKLDSHINYDGGMLLTFKFLNYMDNKFTLKCYNDLLEHAQFKEIIHTFDFLTERNWSYSEEDKLDYEFNHEYKIPIPKMFVDAFDEIPSKFNFDGVRKSEFYKNEKSFSKSRVLIFRDSSANLLKWFFPFYFRESFFYWDHGYINEDVIKWYNPDVIIELRTERLLDNIPTPEWVKCKKDIFSMDGH